MESANKKDRKQKQRQPLNLDTMIYGRVPPQATDLESAVLGAIMSERNAFDQAFELLRPESFYLDANQRIFKAMFELNKTNSKIDSLTVCQQLKSSDELSLVGGPYHVQKISDCVVSSAHIETHCRIIKQKFLAREMIRLSGETIAIAYEDSTDVFDMMADHERQFTEITSGGITKSYVTMDVALVESLKRIESMRQKTERITGIPSGIPDLDKVTHGWQKTDLIILAARPAVGKTAFALQMARNAALNANKPVPVAFFSLEMSTVQLTDRNLSAESELHLESIRNGSLEDGDMKQLYERGVQRLLKAMMFIDDTPALNIFELRSRARRLKRLWLREFNTDEGLIIIDYLQLMSGPAGMKNTIREQEISQISRGLKQLAKELNLPIMALSQLSRAVEQRAGDKKMPQLSDLRESGAIEQDADMVMFLYRPEYYENISNEMGESNKGETHLRIAKHRNGSLETIKMRANLSIQNFFPWEGPDAAPMVSPLPTGNWRPVNLPYADDNKKDLPF